MKFNNYQAKTTNTFKDHKELTAEDARLLDWAIGLAGEVGEVCELIKHYVFHGEDITKVELAKEMGDTLWYLAAIGKTADIPLDAIAELNLAKLQHRHNGGKFSFRGSAERHGKEAKFSDTEEFKRIASKIAIGIPTEGGDQE